MIERMRRRTKSSSRRRKRQGKTSSVDGFLTSVTVIQVVDYRHQYRCECGEKRYAKKKTSSDLTSAAVCCVCEDVVGGAIVCIHAYEHIRDRREREQTDCTGFSVASPFDYE